MNQIKDIAIPQDNSTPGFFFQKDSGEFLIVGSSFPEDAHETFDTICDWIDEYIKKPAQRTVLDFILSYYNSVSASYFFDIMKKIEKLKDLGYNASIRWFYNEGDIDLMEDGEEYKSLLDIDFEMVLIGSDTKETIEEKHIDDLIDGLF